MKLKDYTTSEIQDEAFKRGYSVQDALVILIVAIYWKPNRRMDMKK